MPLSLWYSQWSSLTPLSPTKLGHGWGAGVGVCVRMGGADEDEEEVVVEVLIPLGGQWGGEV